MPRIDRAGGQPEVHRCHVETRREEAGPQQRCVRHAAGDLVHRVHHVGLLPDAAGTAERHLAKGLVYPPVEELQEASIRVATAVIRQAFKEGVATSKKVNPETAESYVRSRFWHPRYLPVVRG